MTELDRELGGVASRGRPCVMPVAIPEPEPKIHGAAS